MSLVMEMKNASSVGDSAARYWRRGDWRGLVAIVLVPRIGFAVRCVLRSFFSVCYVGILGFECKALVSQSEDDTKRALGKQVIRITAGGSNLIHK